MAQIGRKNYSQEPSVVAHSCYVQTMLINLISSLNWEI